MFCFILTQSISVSLHAGTKYSETDTPNFHTFTSPEFLWYQKSFTVQKPFSSGKYWIMEVWIWLKEVHSRSHDLDQFTQVASNGSTPDGRFLAKAGERAHLSNLPWTLQESQVTSLSTQLLSNLPESNTSWDFGRKVLLELPCLSQTSPAPWWRCDCPPSCLLYQQLPWLAQGDVRQDGCKGMSPAQETSGGILWDLSAAGMLFLCYTFTQLPSCPNDCRHRWQLPETAERRYPAGLRKS